jgi:septal ring factor EnvC (AmiA/AmiB activator)
MRKQVVIASLAAVIGATGLTGIGVVSAATDTSYSSNSMTGLVDAVASKFNVNKADVQAVFDEQRDKMEAKRTEQVKTDVAQLVKDGKLTQTQADALLKKRDELQAEREAAKRSITETDKTSDQRQAEMDAKRTELETWAKEQGIDRQYLRFVMGGGRAHGMGGGPGVRGDAPMGSRDGTASSTN